MLSWRNCTHFIMTFFWRIGWRGWCINNNVIMTLLYPIFSWHRNNAMKTRGWLIKVAPFNPDFLRLTKMSWFVGVNVTISWGVMVKWGKNVMKTWGQAHDHLCYHDVMIIWVSCLPCEAWEAEKVKNCEVCQLLLNFDQPNRSFGRTFSEMIRPNHAQFQPTWPRFCPHKWIRRF